MATYLNLAGTSQQHFRIGFSGPAVYSNASDPNTTPATPIDAFRIGDIHVNTSTGDMYIYDGTSWRVVDFTGNQETFLAGTVTAPSITFVGDPNTGIYSPAADTVGITAGGIEAARFTTTSTIFSTPAEFPLGTALAPSITFTGDTNTGIYSPGADQVSLTLGGTSIADFVPSGGGGASVTFNATDAMLIPVGTTAQRPTSPLNGMIRYNTTLGKLEVYSATSTSWEDVASGAPKTGTMFTQILSVGTVTASSTWQVPANSEIQRIDVVVDTAYSAGATITVEDTTNAVVFVPATDNDPQNVGVYVSHMDSVVGAADITITATVAGAPAAGAARVKVTYSAP